MATTSATLRLDVALPNGGPNALPRDDPIVIAYLEATNFKNWPTFLYEGCPIRVILDQKRKRASASFEAYAAACKSLYEREGVSVYDERLAQRLYNSGIV